LQVNCYATKLLFWKEVGVQKVLNFLVFRWTICGGYSKTFFHLNLFNGLKRFNAAKNLENLVFWPNNNFSLVFIQYLIYLLVFGSCRHQRVKHILFVKKSKLQMKG
jgi:hypothetical protein